MSEQAVKDQIVQLAGQGQRPERRTLGVDRGDVAPPAPRAGHSGPREPAEGDRALAAQVCL